MSTSDHNARTKAYSYTRFSTPEQSQGDSARRQVKRAQEYAERHSLDLDTSLRDEGISAFRGKNMAEGSALSRFLERVRAADVETGSVLLLENLDRFSRGQPLKAGGVLQDLCDLGITIVTLHNERAYTAKTLSDPMTALSAVLELSLAHDESVKKADRLRRAWDGKRAKIRELPLTSVAPAWLRLVNGAEWEVIEERAAVVRRIYADTLQGCSPHAIGTALNIECVPVFGHGKRKGKYWHRSYIAKLLANAAVVGTMTPHTGEHSGTKYRRKPLESVHGYFPAIVPQDVYESVQALRLDARAPLRGRHVGGAIHNIFGGLGRCGVCGDSSVRFVNKGSGWTYLVCSRAMTGAGCKYDAVRYQTIEDAFRLNYGNVLGTAPAGKEAPDVDSQLADTEGAISALESRLEALLNSRDELGSVAVSQRIAATGAELDELRSERAGLQERQSATLGKLRTQRMAELSALLDAPELDRKATNLLLRQLFSRVTLDPTQGTLAFEWKQGGQESVLLYGWPRG